MATEFRVGIVTVSYGSSEDLDLFLTTLRKHCGDVDVAVVDNKPGADGVEEVAKKHRALYLPLASNPGYGAGMNAGVNMLRSGNVNAGDTDTSSGGEHRAHAGNDYEAFFICNPDIHFTEDSITPLLDVLTREPSIGSVGPKLLNDDGTVYPSAREIPSVGNGIGHGIFGAVWPNNPWTRRYKSSAGYDSVRDAGWLSGAAVMVKTSVWDAIAGFDETYFLNFEDIDLGFRIGKAGYRNVFVPTTSVVHVGGHSLKKNAEAAERAMHESAVRFMRKRYAGFWNTPIRWAVILGLRVRGALTLRSIRRAR